MLHSPGSNASHSFPPPTTTLVHHSTPHTKTESSSSAVAASCSNKNALFYPLGKMHFLHRNPTRPTRKTLQLPCPNTAHTVPTLFSRFSGVFYRFSRDFRQEDARETRTSRGKFSSNQPTDRSNQRTRTKCDDWCECEREKAGEESRRRMEWSDD